MKLTIEQGPNGTEKGANREAGVEGAGKGEWTLVGGKDCWEEGSETDQREVSVLKTGERNAGGSKLRTGNQDVGRGRAAWEDIIVAHVRGEEDQESFDIPPMKKWDLLLLCLHPGWPVTVLLTECGRSDAMPRLIKAQALKGLRSSSMVPVALSRSAFSPDHSQS